MLNTPKPGGRMAFATFRGVKCMSSLLRLVCTAPVPSEHLASRRQHSPKAPWVSAGSDLLSGCFSTHTGNNCVLRYSSEAVACLAVF